MPTFEYVGPWAEAEVVLLGRVVKRGDTFTVDDADAALLLEQPAAARPAFVAITSAAGEHGLYHLSAYCMAKHAVVGLVRALAADVAGHPVTVAGVSPGSTSTDWVLPPNRRYIRGDGMVLFDTDARGLLPGPVAASIMAGGNFWDGFAWEQPAYVGRDKDGVWQTAFEPEDWRMSRFLADRGIDYAATWAIRVTHHGAAQWPNF